jgi:hypothetical protein
MIRVVEATSAQMRIRFSETVLGGEITAVGLLVSWLFLDTCTIGLSRDAEGAVNCRIENRRIS